MGEGGLQVYYRLDKGNWLWANTAFRIGYTRPIEDRRQYGLRPLFKDEKAGVSIDQRGFRETLAQGGGFNTSDLDAVVDAAAGLLLERGAEQDPGEEK